MKEEIKRTADVDEVYLFERVTSTNDIAKKLTGKNHSALILAKEQTKGKGRFGKEWYSPEGGLWFSLLFFPQDRKELSCLTLLSTLATRRAIEELTHLSSHIRWPNDVIFNNKKVAGILSETFESAIIIGIGVNVNQNSFPPSLPNASSLMIETGKSLDIKALLIEILRKFREYYKTFERDGFDALRGEAKRYSSLLSKFVTVDIGALKLTGTVIDIDDQGRLVFRPESGRLLTLSSGEVKEVK